MKGVSIVICCFNSSQRLPDTLYHISKQKVLVNLNWELIIVDNNSTDETLQIAYDECKKRLLNLNFKIVSEVVQGLSAARLRGALEAKYDFLLFCDDDNWLSENYVSTAFEKMNSHHQIGILGGRGEAVSTSTTNFPKWFAAVENSYAVGKPLTESGDATSRKYLWGAGIVIRKKLYFNAHKNNPSLLIGRKGEDLSSGEDAELCARAILLGYTLHYEEQLHFKHFILPERLTKTYFKKLIAGHKASYDLIKYYWHYIDYINQPQYVKWEIIKESIYRIILSFIKPQNHSRKYYYLQMYFAWRKFNFQRANSYKNILQKFKLITQYT